MTDLVVDGVSKRYRVARQIDQSGAGRSLRGRLRALRSPSREFWALRDVSFDVQRGETLGIIGDNGAGKSTILKLLSNVTSPTSGRIMIRGRLSALIEVGSGFHPELTGRENVYLSGSILGMGRQEIAGKIERIIEFAGVRDFIDTPVKRYSSGMYLRLGFSIAAHLEPDVLLLDEVLAVGDAEFQAKCLERVNELHRQGTTIVFISHDLSAVERLCRRVVLLSHGRVLADGPARDVIWMYQELARARTATEASSPVAVAWTREAEILSVAVFNANGDAVSVLRTGEAATVRINYQAKTLVPDAVFEIYAYTVLAGQYGPQHGPWCQLTTSPHGHEGVTLSPGRGVVDFEIAELGIQPGECYLSCRITRLGQPSSQAIDWRPECAVLRVEPGCQVLGTFYLPHRSTTSSTDAATVPAYPVDGGSGGRRSADA